MARHGPGRQARHGVARLGAGRQAGRGMAGPGAARVGRHGVARLGLAWQGWAGKAMHGKARRGRQKEFINEQTERFCKPLPALPQAPRARICAAKGLADWVSFVSVLGKSAACNR